MDVMWKYITLACVFGSTVARNSEFDKYVKDYWNWRMEQSPEFTTLLGSRLFTDRWQSLTEETFENDTNTAKYFLSRLEIFDLKQLDEADVVTLKVIKTSLTSFVRGYKYRKYTQYNPITPLDYPSRDWKNVIAKMPLDTRVDYENLIARYTDINKQVNQFIILMRKAIRLNVTQHSAAVTGATERLDALINAIENKTSFFHEKVKNISDVFTSEEKANISQRINTTIEENIKPAVKMFRDFLEEEYIRHTRPLPGLSSLPGGIQLYEECLRWHLNLNLTAQEIHDIGKSEVRRITSEMKKLMKTDNFTGSVSEYLDYMKSRPECYYKTEEAMLDGYRDILKLIHGRLDTVLPKTIDNCPVTVQQNKNPLGWARYLPVTDDAPGIFLINVFHPETRPTFGMTSLTLHETEPGHHTQECYMKALGTANIGRQVSFLKYYAAPFNFPFFTSFVEGWGLYAESLGEEMAVYDTSDKLLGRYLNEIFRAARMVVDTGIHAFGWSKERAVEYLSVISTRSRDDIINEVNRYISLPGQACSYKVGELHIKKLRAKAENILGKDFDKRYFHDSILRLGNVPLSLLDEHIDKWIKQIRSTTSGCRQLVFSLVVPTVCLLTYFSLCSEFLLYWLK